MRGECAVARGGLICYLWVFLLITYAYLSSDNEVTSNFWCVRAGGELPIPSTLRPDIPFPPPSFYDFMDVCFVCFIVPQFYGPQRRVTDMTH